MANLPLDHETTDLAELTPEQEQGIEESIAEIERGDYVTAEHLLEQLRAIRER